MRYDVLGDEEVLNKIQNQITQVGRVGNITKTLKLIPESRAHSVQFAVRVFNKTV